MENSLIASMEELESLIRGNAYYARLFAELEISNITRENVQGSVVNNGWRYVFINGLVINCFNTVVVCSSKVFLLGGSVIEDKGVSFT